MKTAIGAHVVYVDSLGHDRPAIVTALWENGLKTVHGVNLVVVSDDETKTDTYGRQIERFTSVVHQSQQAAAGNCWK